jgi:hypothetical protein
VHRITCAALVLMLAGRPGAAEEQLCQLNAFGSVRCLGPVVPPPEPRPPLLEDQSGLDALLIRRPPESGFGDLVPARRTNSFDQTRIGPGEAARGGAPCRRGALGNLRC